MLLRKLREMLGLAERRSCYTLCLYPTRSDLVDLKDILGRLLSWTQARGIAAPTWMEIDAKGVSGRNLRFDTAYKKISHLQGSHINELWLNCALPGVDDRFVGWSWAASLSRETGISIFFDTTLDRLALGMMRDLATELIQGTEIHYGFATTIPFYYGPYFWVSGMLLESQDGVLSEREGQRVSKWSHARIEAKKLGITLARDYFRDIYEINFVTSAHLRLPVESMTLAGWIETSSKYGQNSLLKEDLYCWCIPNASLRKTRKTLGRALHLVCYGGYGVRSGGPYGHTYPY